MHAERMRVRASARHVQLSSRRDSRPAEVHSWTLGRRSRTPRSHLCVWRARKGDQKTLSCTWNTCRLQRDAHVRCKFGLERRSPRAGTSFRRCISSGGRTPVGNCQSAALLNVRITVGSARVAGCSARQIVLARSSCPQSRVSPRSMSRRCGKYSTRSTASLTRMWPLSLDHHLRAASVWRLGLTRDQCDERARATGPSP